MDYYCMDWIGLLHGLDYCMDWITGLTIESKLRVDCSCTATSFSALEARRDFGTVDKMKTAWFLVEEHLIVLYARIT